MCVGSFQEQRLSKLGSIRLRHDPAWAVRAHGWPLLCPFRISERALAWAIDLPRAGARVVQVQWTGRSRALSIWVDGGVLGKEEERLLRQKVSWMFRADERFEEFWGLCEHDKKLRECSRRRMGALIRSPDIFEDVVKTMCTVNCHWRNTQKMVEKLCVLFGKSYENVGSLDGKQWTFPSVQSLAGASERGLKKAGLGFRAAWVSKFARSVVDERIDLDAWSCEQDVACLRASLLGVVGLGSYSANHMLMLLGHYAFVPCDSEVCSYLGFPPKTQAAVLERTVQKRYRRWGKYAFLAYKFERVLAGYCADS